MTNAKISILPVSAGHKPAVKAMNGKEPPLLHETIRTTQIKEIYATEIALAGAKRNKLPTYTSPELLALIRRLGEEAEHTDSTSKYAADKTFIAYLSHMAKAFWETPQIKEKLDDPLFRQALLDYIADEYAKLMELRVPKCIIRNDGHCRTAADFQKIQDEALETFGKHDDTRDIARTAMLRVWGSRHSSIRMQYLAYRNAEIDAVKVFSPDEEASPHMTHAKRLIWKGVYDSARQAYDSLKTAQRDVKEIFCAHNDMIQLEKTAIRLVWDKKYPYAQNAYDEWTRLTDDAAETFGKDKKAKGMAGYAVYLVWIRGYPSMKKAHLAYKKAEREKGVFVKDKEASDIVQTAVSKVFDKHYPSMRKAYIAYKKMREHVAKSIGDGDDQRDLVKQISHAMFGKEYKKIAEIKLRHDKNDQDKLRLLRRRAGDLGIPNLQGLDIIACWNALAPLIEAVGRMYYLSFGGADEAKSEAKLAALALLQKGERDADKLIDAILCHVDYEASKESHITQHRAALWEADINQ